MKLAAATACFLLSAVPSVDEVGVGEAVPALKFRELLGGDGRTTLAEYRGSPVLFAWYSTVPAGMNAAPGALGLADKFVEAGLVVVLMEIKNNDLTHLRALQMKELPGASCLLLKNQNVPFAYDDGTGPPPKVALVGVDGTLLFAGSYQKLRDVEKLLKTEAGRRTEGWGEHAAARSARAAAFGAGDLAAGRATLRAALAAEPGNAELEATLAEIDGRYTAWKASTAYLRDAGEYRRALVAAEGLVAATAGDDEWSAEARERLAAFESEELQAALKLEAKLDKLLKPLLKKRPKKGQWNKFRSFAEKAGDSPLAARARAIADALEYAVQEL